jgi:asparagine synthase (glutamine-hydrolysing)
LDSTVLAGLATQANVRLKSFTVYFGDQQDIGERVIAAETARAFGLDHTEISMPMSTAQTCFRNWLTALDQPSIDGLNVYTISQAVREQGIKVALSGLGADELFGGYPSFKDVPRLKWFAAGVKPLPQTLRRGLARVATIGRSSAVKDKLSDMLASDGSLRTMYFHRRRSMSDSQLRKLGILPTESGLGSDFLSPEATWDVDANGSDPMRQISQLEFRCYQGNMLLRDCDVNGMAFGLEIRVPFLDRKILDLAHTIPSSVRFPNGHKPKWLLRTAFADKLRPEVINHRKLGFTLPIGRWMAGDLRPLCEASLASLKTTGLLQASGIDSIWHSFLRDPKSQVWSRVLSLVVLGQFLERNSVGC